MRRRVFHRKAQESTKGAIGNTSTGDVLIATGMPRRSILKKTIMIAPPSWTRLSGGTYSVPLHSKPAPEEPEDTPISSKSVSEQPCSPVSVSKSR